MKKLLIICVSVFMIIFGIIYYSYTSSKFSKEKWELNPENRLRMIDSLTSEYELIGLRRDEIINLLGTNNLLMDTEGVIEYFVSSGMGDVVGFNVYFDENEVVINYEIASH